MREWEESTVKGSIAAPAAGPDGTAVPPSGPSGQGHGRRVGLVIGLLVVLVALGGGVFLFVRSRDHKPAPVNQVAAVRHAYLTWWDARVQEYLTLNSTPVKPFMTAAGYKQEQALLAQQNDTQPFQLVATHNLHVVVYSDGADASVDDVWLSNSGFLDPTSRETVGSRSDLTADDSTSLKKVDGRWLVDDVVRFGASQAVQGIQLSYVAVSGGVPPAEPVTDQIIAAFSHYERVRDSAYLALDPQPLVQVETGPALSADLKSVGAQSAIDQPIRFVDQDNYRVALQDPTTAWIYDTVGDQTVGIDTKTRAPVRAVKFTVQRAIYGLTKGDSGWTVNYFGVI